MNGEEPDNMATRVIDEIQRLLRRLRVYGKSLPGTPFHLLHERTKLLNMVNTGVLDNCFSFLLMYGANDYWWPEVYRMLLGYDPPASLSKQQRLDLLAANPVLATRHCFDRERAFWQHIFGQAEPLGPITD